LNKLKTILGISAFYHDSAAALLQDGKIIAAAQEERFTRKKQTPDFPVNSIRFCLDYAGCSIDDLDAVVFYDKPLLKFERLLETYYAFAPKGLFSFLRAIPVWMKEKIMLKKVIREGLASVEKFDKKKLKLLFPEHHLSHAASAFYSSPFREAAILTIDGVGEWATASICHGKDNKIQMLKEMRFPHSVGLLYSAFTYYLGFKVNSGEYKLMGLAPYGNPEAEQTRNFITTIKTHLINIKDDGSVWLNQEYFNYSTGLTMTRNKKWEKLFGFPALTPGEETEQKHCNLAFAIQNITEEIVMKMATEAYKITGLDYLCMAGGVALNCVANGKLLKENIFRDIFIQPAAGDAGGALGAAQIANYMYFGEERAVTAGCDEIQGAFLGPEFSDKEIIRDLNKLKASYHKAETFNDLCSEVAELIDNGNVIGWFQGRMEFGPRALGNRSILGDARNTGMQKKLNLKIKYRESFRPFAPAVMYEDCGLFFDIPVASPYMLFNGSLIDARRNILPENYQSLDLWEKLYFVRSDVPAITHLDFSARIQTVHKETNPKFAQLINAFKSKTGYGIIVNTSFNVRGEPIVCTPEDAYRCFMRTEMDWLVINDFIMKKTDQPDRENRAKWMESFNPD
jgi:carbamoyltransferase